MTFDQMLQNFAYHCGEIMTGKAGHVGFALGADVHVEMAIVPESLGGLPPTKVDWASAEVQNAQPNVWDQVWTKDDKGAWRGQGNRCGGREFYAKTMAPVLRAMAVE